MDVRHILRQISVWKNLILLLLTMALLQLDFGIQASNSTSVCLCNASRTLIIWHAWGKEDNNLFTQKRFIVNFLDELPINTAIHVTTVDSVLNMQFKNDGVNFSWKGIIASYTPGHGSPIVPYHFINKAVENFLDAGGNQHLAEEIFFVMNESSVIRQEEKLTEELADKVSYLIYTGTSQPPEYLTTLATDRYHVALLNTTNTGNITTAVESVKRQSCIDSQLLCGANRYWNGKRCRSCSYICSSDTTERSEQCLNECPYFRRRSTSFTGSNDSTVSTENQCSIITYVLIIFVVVNTFVYLNHLVLIFYKTKCWKRFCRIRNNGENSSGADDSLLQNNTSV